MIGNYLTDMVTIFAVTIDEWGNKTETPNSSRARVERTSAAVNYEGRDIAANYVILLPSNISIKIGDYLRIESQGGLAANQNRKYPVMSVFAANGFGLSHQEITI